MSKVKSLLYVAIQKTGLTREKFAKLIKYPVGSIHRHLWVGGEPVPKIMELACAYIIWSVKKANAKIEIDRDETFNAYLKLKGYSTVADTASDLGVNRATVYRVHKNANHSKHVIMILAIKYLALRHVNRLKEIKGERTDDIIDAIEKRIRENSL